MAEEKAAVLLKKLLSRKIHNTHCGRQSSNQANRLGLCVRLYRLYRHIRCRHLLSLLFPKADTHFTIPRWMEGWVDL